MSSLTANMISADLDSFKMSMAQSQYNSGHYATVTHYRYKSQCSVVQNKI